MRIINTFFDQMPYEDKVEAIYQHANMIADVSQGNKKYDLYCIEGSFVEVVVNADTNKILAIRSLEDSERLLRYCQSVDLGTLLN